MLRLCKRHEFEAVFAYDCAVSSALFIVRARPNGLSRPRLGIIAGKKALPRAVDRNRGKRLTREVFRQAEQVLGALDVVVQLRAGAVMQTAATAREDLLRLFTTIHVRSQDRATRIADSPGSID